MKKLVITTKNGSQTVAKTKSSPMVKFSHVGYCFILRHKEDAFLKQFYHGANGVILGSEKQKQISILEKRYANANLHELLGADIKVFNIDGRTKEAKKLPYYSIDMLI